MSEEVQGILVGHGKLAEGLLDALRSIAGSDGGIHALDNEDLTPEALEERIDRLIGDVTPTVIFVDLPSGSCAFAARRLRVRNPRIAVVCGVNLPLLLDFVFHRSLPIEEVVERLRTHICVSIERPPDADSTVPRR